MTEVRRLPIAPRRPRSGREAALEGLFAEADVQIDGSRPWDIQVSDQRFYDRVLRDGTLGIGEAYMMRWWDCGDLDELAFKVFRAGLDERLSKNWRLAWHFLRARITNLQRRSRSEEVAQVHYNLSNEFYEMILGETMAYTCGYWKDGVETLEDAQNAKYDLICRKLDLQPGENVLEHGCGWGGFARFAAENYGCHVVAVSISEPQIDYAKRLCRDLPVEVHFCDYRDEEVYNPTGRSFDKVVSIGMCEHVGPKSYRQWFEIVDRQMHDDGLFLLHTLGQHRSSSGNDPFTQKYIFPNCVMPSLKQLSVAAEGLLKVEDLHDFWMSYYFTMREWQRNFRARWQEIQSLDSKFDDRFFRMWNFYNLAGMGAIRSRSGALWHLVFSKPASLREYVPVR